MSRNINKFFSSKVLLIGAALPLTMLGIGLWRETSGTFKVNKEIATLEQQASELQEKNENLKELVTYLESSTYQEKAAREQLNLQLPGEVAVALPGSLRSQVLSEADLSKSADEYVGAFANLNRWWDYFFATKN